MQMKLIAILVSNDLEFVVRAVESVKAAVPVDLVCQLVIVINSRHTDFIMTCKAWATSQKVSWVHTESNGAPGKGHNACLDLLHARHWLDASADLADASNECAFADAEGLYMLDGDDAFYPGAIAKLETVEADVIHLMVHDQFAVDRREHRYLKLAGNFFLYTAHGMQRNHWYHQTIGNPFTQPLTECRTPSRLLYVSKKAAALLRYDEGCALYDDYLPILTMMDLQARGLLTSMAISHPDIYCYHACNVSSATVRFAQVRSEQATFEANTRHLRHLGDDWMVRVQALPYAALPDDPTFTLSHKMAFVQRWFVQVELELHQQRALLAFGRHDWHKALFHWRALEQYGIQAPELYVRIGTALLAMRDGSESGLKAITKAHALTAAPQTTAHLTRLGLLPREGALPQSIVIFTGMSPPFDGADQSKPVYGSELAAIRLAEMLVSNLSVTVCCNTTRRSVHKGVAYVPLADMDTLRADMLIVSRFIYILPAVRDRYQRVVVWLHDARAHEWSPSGPLAADGRILMRNVLATVTAVVCVSDWHRDWVTHWLGLATAKLVVIPNALSVSDPSVPSVTSAKARVPGRFIYASDPVRGLSTLLDLVPELQAVVPHFELHVFFHSMAADLHARCVALGVIVHGRVTPDALQEEWQQAEYMLYPLEGHETYCMNALDAQRHGVLVVAPQSTGLRTSAPDAVLISGICKSSQWKAQAVYHIRELEMHPERKQALQATCQAWARQQTWEARRSSWHRVLSFQSNDLRSCTDA